MFVVVRGLRPLVVQNDEPGFLGCHLHRYKASSWTLNVVTCSMSIHRGKCNTKKTKWKPSLPRK